jgi:hypothetical protein
LFQHYLHTSLADLLNVHILMGTEIVIGSIVIQLDYAETYSLVSCGQGQSDLSHLPAQDGCLPYRLHTEPNDVNLENLTVDVFGVSFEIRSTLKCRHFHRFTGM